MPRSGAPSRRVLTATSLVTTAVLAGTLLASRAIPAATEHFLSSAPPLYDAWDPLVGPVYLIPIAIAAALAALTPRLLRVRRLPTFFALLVVSSLALSFSLNIGTLPKAHSFSGAAPHASVASIIEDPFTRGTEYRAALPAIQIVGVRGFAENYPQLDLTGVLPQHVATHAPGAPILLWAVWTMVGHNAFCLCVMVALIGVLGCAPTYSIAREVYDAAAARRAALFISCSVGVLIYAFTSMDIVFMTAIAVAHACSVRAPRSALWALAWGFLTIAAASLTWGALSAGVVGIGMAALALRRGADARKVAVRMVLGVLGALGGFLLLKATLGIDLLADLGADIGKQTSTATYARPFGYWVVGNLAAFFITAGIAQSSLFFAEAWSRWRARDPGFETVAIATVLLLDLSAMFKGETDHNWLFFLPLVAASAGAATERIRGWVGVSVSQSLLEGALFYTWW